MSLYTLTHILKSGGFTLYILICCSILMLTVVIERFYVFYKNKFNYNSFLSTISMLLSKKERKKALSLCSESESILADTAKALLLRSSSSAEELENAAEASIEINMLFLERHLAVLGTLAVVAPFIGLMGTVLGIMQAFADIAVNASAGPAVVAKGVSEALIATAAGLIVAIPSSVFFNYFKNRLKGIKINMAVFASKLIETLIRTEKGGRPADDVLCIDGTENIGNKNEAVEKD